MADKERDPKLDTGKWLVIKHPMWVPFGGHAEVMGTFTTQVEAFEELQRCRDRWEPFTGYTIQHAPS